MQERSLLLLLVGASEVAGVAYAQYPFRHRIADEANHGKGP
jgi:hypothetical protein